MSEVTDLELVKSIFRQEEAQYDDFLYELHYEYSNGETVAWHYAELPGNWDITVEEVNDERFYDSYGNGYTEDAYVIFSVSDGVNTALYKLPGEYASYEGWTWELEKMSEVRRGTKTIQIWEEI